MTWASTRTSAATTSHSVRRGHVWIGTVVDIEESTLSALKQDLLTLSTGISQNSRDISHHSQQAVTDLLHTL